MLLQVFRGCIAIATCSGLFATHGTLSYNVAPAGVEFSDGLVAASCPAGQVPVTEAPGAA